jgi:nucleotide-binding universal stress UspA family protein
MTFYTLKAAPAASAVELKNNNKSTKAKRILVGCDVHLRGYQAARKVDEGAIGVVDNFRSEEALLLSLEKQLQQAEQVVVVYEAGPLGDTLYRKLMATGVQRTTAQRGGRVKSDAAAKRGAGLVAVQQPAQNRLPGRDGAQRMEYRRQSNARLNHQSRSTGSSTNHCRDGLEEGSV